MYWYFGYQAIGLFVMCGIFCLLHDNSKQNIADGGFVDRLTRLSRRGPDGYVRLDRVRLSADVSCQVHGCILHLRGDTTIQQPLLSSSTQVTNHSEAGTSFFLWNGEVFDGIDMPTDANDSKAMFDVLEAIDGEHSSLLSLMSKINGPWAFVYWQAKYKRLWFGRDMFGRRSLLFTDESDGHMFALSSVIDRPTLNSSGTVPKDQEQAWKEVPACGIFCLDLSNCRSSGNHLKVVQCYTWNHIGQPDALAIPDDHSNRRFFIRTVEGNGLAAPVTVPFCRALPTSVENFHVIEGSMGIGGAKLAPEALFAKLFAVDSLGALVEQLEIVLSESVRKRVEERTLTPRCKTCTDFRRSRPRERCAHAKLAVLFSGGLDSTVLCALAHRFVPMNEPIDLLNVAFCTSLSSVDCIKAYEVPDRISGRQALHELQQISSQRQWNFVEINISKEEMAIESERQIADVVYPLTTVLDNDIGCAVWFAARGKGKLLIDGRCVDYTSPSKVVLTGMGADEQLGGYSRHRACYARDGWPALVAELEMEMKRISHRNLGRDDRVISDHGREARFPFLDEGVVNYLNGLPIWFKANLDLPRGVGDKLLLRTLAFKLGLQRTAALEKRAIQFGSRIAKMGKSRNAADTCLWLKAKTK